MDWLEVGGIRAYGYTGYLEAEKTLGQWFQVDLRLQLDLAPAIASDAIADTLDYRDVIDRVKRLVQESRCDLVEHLAGTIAQTLLEFPQVEKVHVRLTKPHAPIPDYGGAIVVDILRP